MKQIKSVRRQNTIIAPYQRSHFVGLCISNHEAVCWQLKRVCYDCGAISGRGSLLYGAARLGLARRPVQPIANTSAWRRRPPSWAAAAMRLRGSPVSKITMPFGAPARARLSSWPALPPSILRVDLPEGAHLQLFSLRLLHVARTHRLPDTNAAGCGLGCHYTKYPDAILITPV